MNKAQPDTLFQTMEKWLTAYRSLNNCDENKAMDEFDDLSVSIRAAGKGETATEFHNSIKASLKTLLVGKEEPSDYYGKSVPGGRRAYDTKPPQDLPQHVGGPLLETGVDPLGFTGIVEPTVNSRRYQDMVLEKSNVMKPLSHEEVIQIEIGYLNKMITQYDQLPESDKTQSAHKSYLLHRGRVEMLEGLKSRQQVRTGRVLSLKGKN